MIKSYLKDISKRSDDQVPIHIDYLQLTSSPQNADIVRFQFQPWYSPKSWYVGPPTVSLFSCFLIRPSKLNISLLISSSFFSMPRPSRVWRTPKYVSLCFWLFVVNCMKYMGEREKVQEKKISTQRKRPWHGRSVLK